MGSGRDNKAGIGKSGTGKNLDPPISIQRTPTSGSTRPKLVPAITHGKSRADLATAIDAVAKTLVSSNASNVQITPRIPVKRPHEGSSIPKASRTKASDQATAANLRTPSKVDGRPVGKPQPAKSEKAKDDESDEIESLFAAYRPVDAIGAARSSSSNLLTRGLNSLGLDMAGTATATSDTAIEASRRRATTFNTLGVPDTATRAKKAIASIEATTSLFDGLSTTAANPNTTSTTPKSFFTTPNSSHPRSLPLFRVPGTLDRPEQNPNTSGAFTLPIDFGAAPTPNPATASLFDVPKMPETAFTSNPAIASQSSVLSMLDTAPKSNQTTESPFGGLKMAGTASKTNLTTESPSGLLKMAGTAPIPNLQTHIPFSSSKAPGTVPVPNPAIKSSFGLFKLPHTAPGPNPAITSLFGVFETVPTPNPTTTSPFGVLKMVETTPTPNSATVNPIGEFKVVETAPKPNSTTNSPFGVFKTTNTARTPNSASENLLGKVKMPAEIIFSKSNFPASDLGDSQAKGFFGNLSEQARQSRRSSLGFNSTGSSPYPFATTKPIGFNTGIGDSPQTYNPGVFNECKLPPIKPDFNPEMTIAEGLSNTSQPMVPYGHYQPRDHSLSRPFKSLHTDSALLTNITDDSTTQQPSNQFSSPFTQTTNRITFQKTENLIAYQKHAIQELRSSMTWLSEQNEIVSRNLAISTENLGLCGAQLKYFSERCNDLNKICKDYREENVKLQEKLDKVNASCEIEKEKVNFASLSKFTFYIYILVCILVIWLVMSIHK